MSYIINKTDGSVLTEVVDGTIDQLTTDITLVGKNATTYGELFNENFIKILENFANTTQPNKPIEGQLWYDTTEGRLKVYDGSGFKVSGGTIVSTTLPSSFAQGDIWLNSQTQQMYFNDGNANILAGPIYTAQQGLSGFQVKEVIDTNNIGHTILELYVGQVLIGIWSTASFTPLNNIPGYTGNIAVGFNAAYSAIKVNAAASRADAIIAADGSVKTAESFLQVDPADGYSVANGTIRVLNNQALILGAGQNTEFKIASNTFEINSNIINQNFRINSFNSEGLLPSLYVNSANKWIGLYTSSPTATLDVNGDTVIRGNLTVEGATTTINTTNIAIEDLLIELGKVASPSNSTADGGGISLEGGIDGDKTLTWIAGFDSWTSSDNFNLANGKVLKINNFEVLSQTQLGNTVTSAPGLNSVGTLNQLQVDNININGGTVSFLNVSVGDGTIVLAPQNNGTVSINNKRISNLAAPVDNTDAVNKITLTTAVRSTPLGLSVNFTPYVTELVLASVVLSKIYPPAEYEDDTYLRVWCIDISTAKEFRLVAGVWTYQSDL